MLIHYTSETDKSGSKYHQLGERAIEHRVLKIVGDIGNDPMFQVKYICCDVMYYVPSINQRVFLSSGRVIFARNCL